MADCKRPDCSQEVARSLRGRPRLYCSTWCRQTHWKRLHGIVEGQGKRPEKVA